VHDGKAAARKGAWKTTDKKSRLNSEAKEHLPFRVYIDSGARIAKANALCRVFD